MLATAVRRGDLRYPTVIFDDFNRADSTDLGRTSTGFLPWQQLRGSWEIRNNRLFVPTFTPDPLAVVNFRHSDVVAEVQVSSRSGDGLAFRATDANNFFRLSNFYNTTAKTSEEIQTVTEEHWIYVTVPVEIGGVPHTHDYATWEVNGPNDYRAQHGHGTLGDHGDPLALGPFNSREVPVSTSTISTTTITRRIYLDQIQNGSVTQLGNWTLSAAPFRIGVEAVGDQIQVYLRSLGEIRTNVGTPVVSSFNQNAIRHGVSRRGGGRQGTDINTFSLTAS